MVVPMAMLTRCGSSAAESSAWWVARSPCSLFTIQQVDKECRSITRIVKIAEVLQGGVFVNILCLCANCLPGPELWFISRARKKWLFEQVGAVWRAGRAGGRLGPL